MFDTRPDIRESLLNVGIATVSLLIAIAGRGKYAAFRNYLHADAGGDDAARNVERAAAETTTQAAHG